LVSLVFLRTEATEFSVRLETAEIESLVHREAAEGLFEKGPYTVGRGAFSSMCRFAYYVAPWERRQSCDYRAERFVHPGPRSFLVLQRSWGGARHPNSF
jgi:hypothetical protein